MFFPQMLGIAVRVHGARPDGHVGQGAEDTGSGLLVEDLERDVVHLHVVARTYVAVVVGRPDHEAGGEAVVVVANPLEAGSRCGGQRGPESELGHGVGDRAPEPRPAGASRRRRPSPLRKTSSRLTISLACAGARWGLASVANAAATSTSRSGTLSPKKKPSITIGWLTSARLGVATASGSAARTTW